MKEKAPLKQRIAATKEWQIARFKLLVNGLLTRLGPRVFIAVHWPWPLRKPYQRKRLRLQASGGGIGDELMCTPIFSEIKRRNPGCHITFITRFPDFFRAHPDLDEVVLSDGTPDRSAIRFAYHYMIPPPRPLMSLMGECVGLAMNFDRLTPPPITPSSEIREALKSTGRQRVVIQPRSSRWTTNKNWPEEKWRALIGLLASRFEVIEVGHDPLFAEGEFGNHYRSFAGKTDLTDLAYIISQADLFIGPSSGGMHLANAFKVKSVILFGGYESPEGYRYPQTRSFYTPVPCAPCWKRSCPYDIQCLRAIEPENVFAAGLSLLAEPNQTQASTRPPEEEPAPSRH